MASHFLLPLCYCLTLVCPAAVLLICCQHQAIPPDFCSCGKLHAIAVHPTLNGPHQVCSGILSSSLLKLKYAPLCTQGARRDHNSSKAQRPGKCTCGVGRQVTRMPNTKGTAEVVLATHGEFDPAGSRCDTARLLQCSPAPHAVPPTCVSQCLSASHSLLALSTAL